MGEVKHGRWAGGGNIEKGRGKMGHERNLGEGRVKGVKGEV